MINAGSKIRFVNMEMIKVMEVSNPNAIVPPNDEKVKMMKPANNTMDVYMILLPVSIIASLTATGIKKLLDNIS